MSPFAFRFFKQPPDEPERVRHRLEDLEDALRSIKRDFKSLRLEWENAYDKVNQAVQRLNKRTRDQEKAENPPESTNAETKGVDAPNLFRSRILSRRRHA